MESIGGFEKVVRTVPVRLAKGNGKVRELPMAPPPALSLTPADELEGPRKIRWESFREFPDLKVDHSLPHRGLCGPPFPDWLLPMSLKGHERSGGRASGSSRILG
jgi:hypothetical protein